MPEALSPAHYLGALTAGLAQVVADYGPRLHGLHDARPAKWRDCPASSLCQDAARLLADAETIAGPVDADLFADHLAHYAESISLGVEP